MGDWLLAVCIGVLWPAGFIVDAIRARRSNEPARYSTPGPWGNLPNS